MSAAAPAPSAAAAPLAPVDPQALATAEADLRLKEAALERLREDLRNEKARLDQTKAELRQARAARAELESADKAFNERSVVARISRFSSSTQDRLKKAKDAAKRIIDLNNTMTIVNPTVEQLESKLDQTITTFEQALPPLQTAVNEANNRVKEQEQVAKDQREQVEKLMGNRIPAVDFFNLPLQPPISQGPITETPKRLRETTNGYRKKVQFFIATETRDWNDFDPNTLLFLIGNGRTVKKPLENLARVSFDSEREFGEYLSGPYNAIVDVLNELFPQLDLANLHRGSYKAMLAGSVDANLSYYNNSRATMEWKHLSVEFHEEHTVAELLAAGEPTEDKIRIGNVLSSTVQVYSYMVAGKAEKYGCASNWKQWVFYKRELDLVTNKEVLYVSPIYHLDDVRLAFAYWLYLVASERAIVVPPVNAAGLGKVPDWLMPPPKNDDNGNGGTGGGGNPPNASSASGGGTTTIMGGVTSVSTTTAALGITTPLLFVEPFEILGNTSKSQTRSLEVQGLGKVVAKFVNYLGTPKHTEWTEDDLIQLETTEAKAYKHLHALQGYLIPRYLCCGSDFNFIWATATSWEGVAFQRVVDEQGYLPLEIRLRAMAALRRIHEAGVLHGDLALRNVLFREQDKAVVFVDFEMSHIRTSDDDDAWFQKEAEKEMLELDALWHDIRLQPPPKVEIMSPSSDAAVVVARNPSSKRTKIFPGCCC